MAIPAVNLENMGLTGLDLSTEDSAREGIGRIKEALTFVSTVRGRLGAYQNRLENTDRRLDITEENMTAAYSRIMDVDMAEEMTKYSTYTVMTQAGTSVLAQANDRPSTVLQLLQ
jgi:flagellin